MKFFIIKIKWKNLKNGGFQTYLLKENFLFVQNNVV